MRRRRLRRFRLGYAVAVIAGHAGRRRDPFVNVRIITERPRRLTMHGEHTIPTQHVQRQLLPANICHWRVPYAGYTSASTVVHRRQCLRNDTKRRYAEMRMLYANVTSKPASRRNGDNALLAIGRYSNSITRLASGDKKNERAKYGTVFTAVALGMPRNSEGFASTQPEPLNAATTEHVELPWHAN